MKKKYYYKLIRDKIPDTIAKCGSECETKALNDSEFETELFKKVGEEASGLLNCKSKKEVTDELGDIISVINEIRRFKKITADEINESLKKGNAKKGGFKKRLFLIWSSDNGYKTNERRYKKKY